MKKISFLLLAVLIAVSANAQVLNGDLNHNQGLDVEDVTLLIDGYLTGDAEYITPKINFYQEDNSLIQGKWYKSKTASIEFKESGIAEGFGNGNVYEYKFLPSQGRILLFSNGSIYNSFDVVYLTDEQMVIRYIDGSFEVYTRSYPTTKVNRIEICYSTNWDPVSHLYMHVYSNDVIDDERLRAFVFPEDADNKNVIWSSSDEDVVFVDNGYVMAVGEGTAVITCEATDGSGVKATCPVTVTEIRWVTKIALSETYITSQIGYSYQLTATVTPSNATNTSVTWRSSDTSVATVSNNGVVTTQGVGTATITCKAADGSGVEATCKVVVRGNPVTNITLSPSTLTLEAGKTKYISATVTPSNATNKNLTWKSSDTSVATVSAGVSGANVTAQGVGTATITCEAADGSGVKATCTVVVKTYNNGHEYVDLGLSVKWATVNIGASSPETPGSYFAWGETTPKSTYNWGTYKHCKGSMTTLTKYCRLEYFGNVDNKTVLDLSDDAARYNWGGTWRIPTYSEMNELIKKCNVSWAVQNGVEGRKITGPNGNSIFLPATGYYSDSSIQGTEENTAIYSTNSIYANGDSHCSCLYFNKQGNFNPGMTGWYRYNGLCVRAVCE